MEKQVANILTALRIICSIILLFLPPLSVPIYAVYVVAGISDILDGFVARKLKIESKFGSVLDTMADICFVCACLIKLLPILDIGVWLWIWLAVIILIKLTSITLGFIIRKTMVAEHTIMNKITGIFTVLVPVCNATY